MWKKSVSLWLLLAVSLIMTSCGNGGQAQGPAQPDYKSVKDMVLDILQTEEAKNSVAKMMKDDKFTQNLIMDESTVKTTLIQSITNPENRHIKEAFKDPKFASTLAKSMKNEHKTLMKDLMKDPEYQKMLISVMKDPEFEKNLMEMMRSSAYRKQTMQIMKESLQSPLFQEELMKLMTKATEDMMQPKEAKKGQKKGGQGEGGGGGGGSGGESGGGGQS
ncbi:MULTISPECIES: spore germination lipoprotein GerD [Brevibacillus]|jgi:spore germination protein D|uniref:Spore germination protein n=1 Tax=Brevibacillus borstelensis AK1 TaxID=1300222 RepID=M8DAF6_9BACL|nr:spore germination lipoprotein GerD [Brevibacillus borstelensis]EMT50297.1 spore germination protein precursor [Brevibacillus borstelensis AK1]KKX54555.1 spore gernimation protein [Brevibacillus borstelensis cifa_chp40]MBE5393846.1 spore gernimation protein [Brevibacillus borstelensis]MCC0565402.1 spore gernimation protein [Brevibacillus borstelensis]MCM3473042.1 spore germination lipoprotein GerD [Brevibacillus borstelensis]